MYSKCHYLKIHFLKFSTVHGRYLGHVRWTLKIYWAHSVRSTITQITKATSPWCFNTNKIFLHYCVIFQTRCWLDNPIRSSCLRYNHLVRNIYGVQIQFIERPEENHFFNQRNGLEKIFQKCVGESDCINCYLCILKNAELIEPMDF